MIARQGGENQWHFAHASRDVYNKTEKECEFSFFVSVRLMARQIINKSLSINLPEYTKNVGEYLSDYQHSISFPYAITEEQKITLSDIKVETMFMNFPVDIFGKIQNHSFVVYLTHPGREVPLAFNEPDDKKSGVISISLEPTRDIFLKIKKTNSSYKKELLKFLQHNLEAKKWIYHPRQDYSKNIANKKLKDKIKYFLENEAKNNDYLEYMSDSIEIKNQTDEKFFKDRISEMERSSSELVKFKCVMCHSQWQGLLSKDNICPQCETHVYSKIIE